MHTVQRVSYFNYADDVLSVYAERRITAVVFKHVRMYVLYTYIDEQYRTGSGVVLVGYGS